MGAPKQDLKPELAKEEYSDVGLCPFQCPFRP